MTVCFTLESGREILVQNVLTLDHLSRHTFKVEYRVETSLHPLGERREMRVHGVAKVKVFYRA